MTVVMKRSSLGKIEMRLPLRSRVVSCKYDISVINIEHMKLVYDAYSTTCACVNKLIDVLGVANATLNT